MGLEQAGYRSVCHLANPSWGGGVTSTICVAGRVLRVRQVRCVVLSCLSWSSVCILTQSALSMGGDLDDKGVAQ